MRFVIFSVAALALSSFSNVEAQTSGEYWEAYIFQDDNTRHGDPVTACIASHQSFSANTSSGIYPNSFRVSDDAASCVWNRGEPGFWGTGGSAYLECDPGYEVSEDGNYCVEAVIPDGCEGAGNPIKLLSGAKVESQRDFSVGNGRLHFTRFYNSLAFDFDNALGHKWSSNFHPKVRGLRRTSTGWFSIVDESGQTLRFHKTGNGDPWMMSGTPYDGTRGWARARRSSAVEFRFDYQLTEITPNDFVLRRADGFEREFTMTNSQNPVLTKIKYPDGYEIDLVYQDDRPVSATDSHGYIIAFEYNDRGLLEKVTAPDGSEYLYEYKELASTPSWIGSFGTNVQNIWSWFSVMSAVVYPDDTPGTSTDNPKTEYKYDHPTESLALTSIIDERGITTRTWTYDWVQSRGLRALSSVGPSGRESTTIEEITPRTQYKVTNALGKETLYNYSQVDVTPLLASVDGVASANCAASTKSVQYDTRGNMTSRIDAEGQREDLVVNQTTGLPDSITYGAGTPEAVTVNYVWDATIRKPTEISQPDLTTNITYGSDELPSQITLTDTTSHSLPYSTNGQSRTWDYTWQSNGLLQSIDGPLAGNGDKVSFTYDASGNIASVTNELGHTTTINSVDGMGRVTQYTDPNGVVTSISYTVRGWVDSITQVSGTTSRLTDFDYDLAGNLTRIDFPNGGWLSYTYDDSSWLTNVTSSTGDQIAYQYDLLGNVTRADFTGGGGSPAWFTMAYDELGRITQRLGGGGDAMSYAYDRSDRLTTVTDGTGRAWLTGFDALNRVISQTDPELHVVQNDLDADGDLTTYTDARSLSTQFTRNGFGEVIREVSPDRGTTDYWYDVAGRMTRMLDAAGDDVLFTYDTAGRVLTESYPNQAALNVTYTYDSTANGNSGTGRLTGTSSAVAGGTYIYNGFGELTGQTSTVGAQTYSQSYTLSAAGEVTKLTLPSGREVNYAYDTQSRVTSVTTAAAGGGSSQSVISSASYAPFGPIIGYSFGNGATAAMGLDSSHRLSSLSVSSSGASLISKSYSYDANNRVTAIYDSLNNANTTTYAYTPDGRLANADGPWGDYTWTYDPVGNRLTDTRYYGGALTSDHDYTYSGSSNRLLSIDNNSGGVTRMISYTGDGNINTDVQTTAPSRDYDYDDDGRLASVSADGSLVATYDYDAFEHRVRRTEGGTATHFVFSSSGQLIGEYDGATGNVVAEYIWLGDRLVGMVDGTGTLSFVQTGHLGQPLLIMDGTGAATWQGETTPFGVFVSTTGTASDPDLRFPGQWLEAGSGLFQNWHRDYDPTIGRYIEADPLGIAAGQSVYGYGRQDPLNMIDPEGLRFGGIMGPATLLAGVAHMIDAWTNHVLCSQAAAGTPDFAGAAGAAAGAGFDFFADPWGWAFGGAGRAAGKFGGAFGRGGGKGPSFGGAGAGPSPAPYSGHPQHSTMRGGYQPVSHTPTTVIGRTKDLQDLNYGERSLLNRLPNRGSPSSNWHQNAGQLRREMSLGRPIRDASPNDHSGQFLNAERNLLRSHDWTFDSNTKYWHPPSK